ncbi:MAG: hypothetical protein A4S09_07115 [Proteobacteria bacterium SG_bin7]|nr:MAG: hypothetical protein A4S09_07115 [Proteobacteria bacterium SG_bin7]
MFRKIFAQILFFFVAITLKANVLDNVLPYLANSEIDVESYDFSIDIPSVDANEFPVRAKIKLTTNNPTEQIEFHAESKFVQVDTVKINDASAKFLFLKGIPNQWDLNGDVLAIRTKKIPAGQSLTITIDYTLKINDKMAGLFRTQQKLITLSWPYYARFWFPSNDSPLDAATVSYAITTPKGLTAVANGELKEITEQSNKKTYHWAQGKPTTTYNFIFSVGTYQIYKEQICFNFDGKIDDERIDCAQAKYKFPLEIYLEPGNPENRSAIETIRSGASSLIYFSKLFGIYEFEKLGFIISAYPFSMESTSLIVLERPGATVHEIAHHWWGNNVHIPHWGDFWISEGFTTYVTGLYNEYKSGKNTSCLDHKSAEKLNNPPTIDPRDIFNQVPYCKGAASIHALRLELESLVLKENKEAATKSFLNLLANLYKTHKSRSLSTEEFIKFVHANAAKIYVDAGVPIDPDIASHSIRAWSQKWYGL